MTDEEILKRLAEIEGYEIYGDSIIIGETFFPTLGAQWNPITNKSQCFELIEPMLKKGWILYCYGDDVFVFQNPDSDKHDGEHKSLPHAICLAIIAAHA